MKKVLDISENNGIIDFSKVKESGYTDVIIRAGWIGNKNNHTIDRYFNRNFTEAKRYGFNVGVYVFSYCQSVQALKSGAEWLKNLLTNKTLELPVFLDLEDDAVSSTKISICGKENLTEQAIEFCEYFQNQGYMSGVYANKDWFNRLIDVYRLEKYKIWLAEWGVTSPTVSYKVDLWQYTDALKINGISGNVDCSICYCKDNETTNSNNENVVIGDDVEVKRYVNGTTPEEVFADTNCTNKIGTIFPHGECECLGIFENKAMVRYPIYNGNNIVNYKIGFVKWLGGIK